MKKSTLLSVLITFTSTSPLLVAVNATNCYNGAPIPTGSVITIPAGASTDVLNNKIRQASNRANGGTVRLAGNLYTFGQIDLRKNVRLEIPKTTTIKVQAGSKFLFNLDPVGSSTTPNSRLENVIITTVGGTGKFKIDYSDASFRDKNIRAFRIGHTKNISISNVSIKDNFSKISAFTLTPSPDSRGPFINTSGTITGNPTYNRVPENIQISNSSISNAQYGYGLVQAQVGKNLCFHQLSGKGGVTLRVETGLDPLNEAGPTIGTLTRARAHDIQVNSGHAAVMLNPHSKTNGSFKASKLHSIDSSYTLKIDHGFLQPGLQQPLAGALSPAILGTFASVQVEDITADQTTGKNSAQLKYKDFERLPGVQTESQFIALSDDPIPAPLKTLPGGTTTPQVGKDVRLGSPITPVMIASHPRGSMPIDPAKGQYMVTLLHGGNVSSTATYSSGNPDILYIHN